MSSSFIASPTAKNPLLSWEFALIGLLLLGMLAVFLEKPSGSISGRLALQQEGFNLYTYDMKGHHVFAIAIGPRSGESEERGVWVNADGSFKIDQLPVGEYEIKVHVPGFATSYDSGVFVESGKTTGLPHDVTLQLSDPTVTVASNARVYTTKEQPTFWINTNGASKAVVSVYKDDMLSMSGIAGVKTTGFELTSELGLYKPGSAESKRTAMDYFKGHTPVQTWTRELGTDSDDYSHQEYKFSNNLAPGDYFVVAQVSNIQNKKDWNVHWFTVTDLGLIVKQDPSKTLVRAINLTTLRPEPGVSVKLFNRQDNRALLAEAKTGVDGFVSLDRALGGDSSSMFVYGAEGEQHAYGGYSFYNNHADNYETYFYTDRPVYRLGQTMFYKGIARRHKLEGFINPGANVKLHCTIEDPDNAELWAGDTKTNEHGTFHGTFDIPKDGKTGAYQITVRYPDNSVSYERFEIDEYRKPEYIVDVTPIQAHVTAGQKAKARIHAKYYFGAPVTNAKVKYTVFSSVDWNSRYELEDRPSYYSFFDGWDHSDEEYSEGGYGGDYLSEGTATTDANGDAIVEFDTRRGTFDKNKPWTYDYYDKRYKIQAEVTDLSRLTVDGSGALSVTNGEFALFAKSTSSVARVGENIVADVTAIRYDGKKPVAGLPVHIQLYRRIYDRKNSEYKGIQICGETTGTTDASGNVKVDFKTKPEFVTDTYDILATAEDSAHNFIADDYSMWVVSENNPYFLPETEAQKEPLTVKLDKAVYKPGDVARVMITAPLTGKEGAQAIVAVEGAKIYSYKVIDMKSTAQMVEIPLTIDYAPNVYVTVTMVTNKRQFYNQSQMIKVSPESRFLNLSIATDKPRYHPGDLATYTLTAKTADGKPAPNVELSMGLVDESIYAIRADATPDIRKFFYEQRPNAVVTMCTFPEQYSGGPDKVADVRIRKDFKDTATWLPNLVTDKDGIVKTVVKMPDNLTTWRATVRAVSMETEVGSTVNKVISTQDLIVRVALPRFFTTGDEGFVTAVVHNYTDKPQPVNLTLNMTNQLKTTDSLQQKLMVFPDKVLRYSWPIKALTAGEATVTCKAIGSTASDAMQSKVPIRPFGVQSFSAQAGVVTGDDETITIPNVLPTDAAPGSVKYHIYMSSSAMGAMMGNFSSLIDYPYGCTEQTMSKLMPAIVAVRMNQTLGAPLTAKDKAKFAEVYKQSMQKLDGYQHDDGGWGWWANDTSSTYLTALVLDGYKMLREAGYKVDQDRLTKGQAWLKKNALEEFKQLSSPLHKPSWNDVDAMIDVSRSYYVLSKYGEKVPPEVRRWTAVNKQRFTPESLAYLSIAFNNTGEKEFAKVFYNRLTELGTETTGSMGTLLNWAPSKKMWTMIDFNHQSTYDGNYWSYSYRFTGVETTALALEAMAVIEPENVDRAEQVKRWILTERGQDGWENTKTTAEVFKALMVVELGAKGAGVETDFTAELSGADVPASVNAFNQKSLVQPEIDLDLPLKKPGDIKIHKIGHGRLYYSSVLSYYRLLKPGQAVAGNGMPDGLKLKRDFFRMVPGAPDAEGNIHFTAQPLPDHKVKAGETILMKVYVDSPIRAPYVLLQAPLPSGAEVVENDSRSNAAESTDAKDKGGYEWGNWWWTHQDVMDDHIAFFVTSFPNGKAELHQMIRMEIPGKFQINPAAMDGMYTKGIKAYSATDEITVTE